MREVFFKINYPPELVNLVRDLSAAGFTSREPLDVDGVRVVPREVLLALLRKHAPSKEPLDVEALRVLVSGRNKGKRSAAAMEMWAQHTKRPLLSAVARDTGFPCSIAAIMHWRGEIPGTGVIAPENVVPPQPFFNELKRRGFTFRRWNFRM